MADSFRLCGIDIDVAPLSLTLPAPPQAGDKSKNTGSLGLFRDSDKIGGLAVGSPLARVGLERVGDGELADGVFEPLEPHDKVGCARLRDATRSGLRRAPTQNLENNPMQSRNRRPRTAAALISCCLNAIVVPRAGGGPSTPRPIRSSQLPLEYWFIRPSAQLRTRRMMTTLFVSRDGTPPPASPNRHGRMPKRPYSR